MERRTSRTAGGCETRAPFKPALIYYNGDGALWSCAVEQPEQGF